MEDNKETRVMMTIHDEGVSKKLYNVIDVPADGERKWYGGARTMAFIYSRDLGNFIVKGFSDEVEKYIKANYTHYFYYFSMWCNGESRGYWHFWKNDVTILTPSRSSKSWKYRVVKSYENGYPLPNNLKISLEFKRLPKRWIPEFNRL